MIALLTAGSTAWAQTKKPAASPAPATPKPAEKPVQNAPKLSALTEHFLKKYGAAAQWNDYDVVKDALYDLIVENPQNDSLIYSLAMLYYDNQKFASSMLVSQTLLARDPKNLGYLELSAVSGEAVGVYDRALQNYESLFLLTNNPGTLYKIAFLQFDLKRFAECNTNIDILLAKPEALSLKATFNDAENKPKEYPLKVALLNLKGLVAQEQGDKAAAKKYFEEALAAAPDFVPAKQNLGKLK